MPTAKREYPNILIVEGNDDKFSVIGLMEHHTDWSNKPEEWPVWVEVGKSVEEILAKGYLTVEIKATNVKVLGVMLDADDNPQGRYQRIKNMCTPLFPTLPNELPQTGLVVDNADEKRLGVWIMPDNTSNGDLETFLKYLVPTEKEHLWLMACESVERAVAVGAECRVCHYPKANLYTWLSWQDPPGQSPGIALSSKILDPKAPYSEPFVRWFKDLYKLG